MINGRTYDYENIKLLFPKNIEVDVTGIDYEDSTEMNSHHGSNGNAPSVGIGPTTYSGKVKMNREALNQLWLYARGLGKDSLYKLPFFTIVVYFGNTGEVAFVDTLNKVKIKKTSQTGIARSSTNAENELELWIGSIDWALPVPSVPIGV